MAYSKDLRERAIGAIDDGMSKWEVHRTFKVSRTTLDEWIRLREKAGSLEPFAYRHGPKPVIADIARNHAFFKEHSEGTLSELCRAWLKQTGVRVSDVTMSKSLRRLGYTRKKRPIVIKSEMKRKEKYI